MRDSWAGGSPRRCCGEARFEARRTATRRSIRSRWSTSRLRRLSRTLEFLLLHGDIADADVLKRVVSGASSIFHLAAIVSGMAEADFDLGMRINVDATRLLLDVCRGDAEDAVRVIVHA